MDDLTARLRTKLDEVEAWARAASQTSDPGTPTGEHWRWECGECDTPITINPVTDADVECPNGCSSQVFLRSVEEYPSSVGPLSAAIVPYAQEVPAVAGAFIALHDPARELRVVAAHRRLLDHAVAHCRKYNERVECGDAASIEHGAAMYEVIGQLAQAYGIEP